METKFFGNKIFWKQKIKFKFFQIKNKKNLWKIKSRKYFKCKKYTRINEIRDIEKKTIIDIIRTRNTVIILRQNKLIKHKFDPPKDKKIAPSR